MQEFTVSTMEARDKTAIRDICCQTGYAGRDIGPYIDDKNLFADFWTLYYTEYEPESAFVSRVNGKTVGYLTGCLDTKRYNRMMTAKVIPRLLLKAVFMKYRIGKKTRNYIINMFLQLRQGQIYPPLNLYPAHLHINIEEGYRRKGIGEALIYNYFTCLAENSIAGVHLGTTTLNPSAVPFYEKLGFELYSKTENTSFEGLPAYSLIYVKSFNQ